MKVLNNQIPKVITDTSKDGRIDLMLLGKTIPYLLFCILLTSCTNTQGKLLKPTYIKSDYCIINDSYNEMHLKFKVEADTVYLFYSNIIDNGNYLNDYDDTSDFAGFFTRKDIKDSTVTFNIKSYRDASDVYPVKLKFHGNGETVDWNIDASKRVAYLPQIAHFKYCNDKSSFTEIIVEKCPLYKDATEESLTKGYLIKGDHVEILNKKGEWVNIKYMPNEQKVIIRWIKADCISTE